MIELISEPDKEEDQLPHCHYCNTEIAIGSMYYVDIVGSHSCAVCMKKHLSKELK